MASSSEIKAGKAAVEIIGKNSLDPVLKAAESSLKAFGSAVSAAGKAMVVAGTAIVAPIAAATYSFLQTGDALSKMSDRTGIAVEDLSELGYAAQQSGSSLGDVGMAAEGLARFTLQVQRGAKGAVAALLALGIASADFLAMTPVERINSIADGLANIEDPTLRAALALKTLGTSGISLLPLLRGGSQSIEDLRARAKELGLTVSSLDATQATKTGDAIGDLFSVFGRIRDIVAASVLGPVEEVTNVLTKATSAIGPFIDKNRELVRVAALVGVGLVGVGGAVNSLGAGINSAGTLLRSTTQIFTTLSGVLAFLATPAGIVTAAIVALGVAMAAGATYFLMYTETGKAALAELMQILGEFLPFVQTTFRGISDAIEAGDLEAALRVAGAGLKAIWTKTVNELQKLWNMFVLGMTVMLQQQIDAILARIQGIIPAAKALRDQMSAEVGVIASVIVSENAKLDKSTADAFAALQAVADAARKQAVAEATAAAASKASRSIAATPATEPASRSFRESIGTFSSAVAGLLGRSAGERQWEQIARNTKDSSKTLEGILDELEDAGPLVFE